MELRLRKKIGKGVKRAWTPERREAQSQRMLKQRQDPQFLKKLRRGRKLNQWSRKYKQCIRCGTNKRKHYAKGMCQSCYYRFRYWQKRGIDPKPLKQWSREYDHCIRCGTTERKHCARGICVRCYMKERYRRKIMALFIDL